ncbi:hypothetical protein PIB30_118825 [Stylosanthes scabra]|uniref:Uncharacterized protein n=1 Tax=Stylosanthes scabra TaxID=79078 RepID=A0ABU6Z417_9FABA|nr:hypothetical protein [Stylosanthes scabra]
MTWLDASMSLTYKNKVVKCSSFAEAWEKISQIFLASSNTRIQSIKTQLRATKKTGTIAEYLTSIQNLVDSLHSLGHDFTEADHVLAITDGLPDEYDGYVTSMLSRLTTFTIHEAESFLNAYENRINKKASSKAVAHIAQGTSDSTQSYGRGTGGRTNRGTGGNRGGRGGRFQNNRPQCQLCGRIGHAVQTCYHRFDPHYQTPNPNPNSQIPYSNTQPPPPATTFHQPKTFFTTALTPSESSWFADCGATHHVTAGHSNILQHGDGNQGPEQLFVGYQGNSSQGQN